MQSIRESVHQLLEDQITRLGYQHKYEVQKAEIIGRNGTSFNGRQVSENITSTIAASPCDYGRVVTASRQCPSHLTTDSWNFANDELSIE
jgi:hypothetical protein